MEDLDRVTKRRGVDIIALKAYCTKSHYSSWNPAILDVPQTQKTLYPREGTFYKVITHCKCITSRRECGSCCQFGCSVCLVMVLY